MRRPRTWTNAPSCPLGRKAYYSCPSVRTLTIRTQQEETAMLTRRGFAGFASCALCGLAEFAATEVSAQGAPPPAPAGFTRKILSQMDGPAPGYTTLVVEVNIDPGTFVARHTHPGIRVRLRCLGRHRSAGPGTADARAETGRWLSEFRSKRRMPAPRTAKPGQ